MVPLYGNALTIVVWIFVVAALITIFSFWCVALSHSLFTCIVLSLSILFNIFFIGGIIQSQYHNSFQYWDFDQLGMGNFIKLNIGVFLFDLAGVGLIFLQVYFLNRANKRRKSTQA